MRGYAVDKVNGDVVEPCGLCGFHGFFGFCGGVAPAYQSQHLIVEGLNTYRKSVHASLADSPQVVGTQVAVGKLLLKRKDDAEAARYLRMAADQGDGRALELLSAMD